MAFADWTQVLTGNMTSSLDLGSPINGAGSLLCSRTSTSTNTSNEANMHLNTGSFTVGVTKGRIRSLIQIENSGVGAMTAHYAAIIACMYDPAFSTTTTANDGYIAGFTVQSDGDQAIRIMKCGVGIASGTSFDFALQITGNLAQVKPFGPLVDQDILPIEFEWVLDVPNLGGIRLTFRRGNVGDTDFSNLSTILDVIDAASPHTVASFEGLVTYNGGSGSGGTGSGVRWDDTTVSELL